jgi:hypothetical protein
MYVIELIVKLIKNKGKKFRQISEDKSPEICEHIFLPVDSTKTILACSKCGFVIKAQDLTVKPKNPFN